MPELNGVIAANRANLLDVMQAMDQMETTPLLHGKRTEDYVRDCSTIPKEMVATGGNLIQLAQFSAYPCREFVARLNRRR